MHKLTARQQKVLDYIVRFSDEQGYSPALRDIAAHMGVASTFGVARHLDALEKKGFLTRSGRARSIVLSNPRDARVHVPIVGTVRAGALHPAIEDIQGHFAIDASRVTSTGCFFLRVTGDSMIEAGILDGDLALVQPQPTAKDNEIVVVLVDEEATLKRFFRDAGRIRLEPANRKLPPIVVGPDRHISILGKVTGIYRDLEPS
jgi:repressor LexA